MKTLCTDTAHPSVKHGSGALIVGIGNYWASCAVEQLRSSSQESYCWTLVRMDPEQLVAQLAELRTQNQQSHQALQQVQQQQMSAIRSRPSLVRLATVPCADSGCGSVSRSKSSTSQSNLGGHERFRKASTAEEHGKRIRDLGTTHRELPCERAPWSERRLAMGRGKRIGNGVGSERSNGSRDASGHSANAGTSNANRGEPLDILMGSGAGEGLEAWRRVQKNVGTP